tara:strand:- start:16 stop:936 length:921 start_codon:yes stop_codon:yes gene_type:complete
MHKNSKNCHQVISFYKFINIKNPLLIKELIINFDQINNIKGTIIISKEGINGSVFGSKSILSKFFVIINKNVSNDIIKNANFVQKSPFPKFKVKIKKEIVKIGFSYQGVKKKGGIHVSALKWDKLCTEENVVILDTRNHYESDIGSFNNSLLPNINSFSEFPSWVNKNWDKIKDKKILTYCTGGIRCEKATSLLISRGNLNVYQLKGGILKYLSTKDNSSNFNGECFVFDDRVTVDKNLKKGKYSMCFACGSAISKVDFLSSDYKKGISCSKCINKTSKEQKRRFSERQKQINFAKQKGIKHLGQT